MSSTLVARMRDCNHIDSFSTATISKLGRAMGESLERDIGQGDIDFSGGGGGGKL